jgi:hypothetical protein
MRIDRAALIRGMFIAVGRERERRQAAEQAAHAEAWQGILDKIAEMAARLAVGRDAEAARELGEQIAQAPNWTRIDELRIPADRSPAECAALCWMIGDQDAAVRLLREYCAGRG